MDIKSIMQLLESVESTKWKVFEVKENDFSLRLERGEERPREVMAERLPNVEPMSPEPAPLPPEVALPRESSDIGEIKSPVVGVFHELPGEKAVKPGAVVKKGTPVCIVEAMKLMNEVVMPEDGAIIWQVAREGDAVEYGQLLFQYNAAQEAEEE